MSFPPRPSRHPFALRPVARATQWLVASMAFAATAHAQQAPAGDASAEAKLPEVKVTARQDPSTEGTGSYKARTANTATKLELSPRETPQSISVVTRTTIEDFGLNDATGLLTHVAGVNVERVEPDRNYYSVRGFEVSNFQVDGVGLPFATGDQLGNIDTVLYDRVEVLRGANGLMSSTGNPSATVNFVRKRPTEDFRASAAFTLGSWSRRRAEADVSGPLTKDNRVRGRVIVAAQEGDSYIDRYSLDKQAFGALLDWDLLPGTTLTLGHSQQHNKPKGVMWGALPLHYSDGTPTNYPVSANAAPGWTYWNTDDVQTFAELTHRMGAGWQAKATVTRRELSSDAELFFLVGTPDRATGTGMTSFPSKYGHTEKQWIADVNASGPFSLGGRTHELVVGANWSRSVNKLHSHYDDVGVAVSEGDVLGGAFPRPAFDQPNNPATDTADFTNRRASLYGVARINASDTFKLFVGANATRAASAGVQYAVVHDYTRTRTSPYFGATWAFHPQYSLYGSWASIFNPQHQTDQPGNVLPPIEGRNAEVGVKGEWLQGRLAGSLALFEVKQNNTAEAAGFDVVAGRTYYRGIDATSRGFEAELTGTLAKGWEVTGGYTQLNIKDPDGNAVRTYVPRRTLRLTTSARVPALPGLKLGASVKWQSEYERNDGGVVTRQDAYALLDLAASYEINRRWSLTAKLENATDKRHLNSLMWPNQAYYGEPRNGSVTLKWTY